jgi:dihydroxy-acid dehydratase
MVYGGTIKPGHLADGTTLDIVSAFQCYGEYVAGRIDDGRRADIVRHACPGAGACGGMYTANTMATAIEALGMALPDSASIPAEHPAKLDECLRAGAAVRRLLELDLKPRTIMTRRAFENAMAWISARPTSRRWPGGFPTSPTSSRAASSCRRTCTRSAARAG